MPAAGQYATTEHQEPTTTLTPAAPALAPTAEAVALIADAQRIRTVLEAFQRRTDLSPAKLALELAIVDVHLGAIVDRHPGLDDVLRGGGDDDVTHERTTAYLETLAPGAGGDVFKASDDARRVVAAVGIFQAVRHTVATRQMTHAAELAEDKTTTSGLGRLLTRLREGRRMR